MYIYLILIAHYLGDYPLQDYAMFRYKDREIKQLMRHAGACTLVLLIFLLPYVIWFDVNIGSFFFFLLISFTSHMAIDRISSKINRGYYERMEFATFFNIIGLDQLVHYILLLGSYQLLCT